MSDRLHGADPPYAAPEPYESSTGGSVRHSRAVENVRPLAMDLYAGAGGLSLGMDQAGFDVIAAAEFDPIHALTHRFNFPQTPVLCRDLSEERVEKISTALSTAAKASWHEQHPGADFPGIDAIVGGPPCQGFSVGGVRDPIDDRNSQLLRFVDLVVHMQPKVFCLENVAGILEPRFEGLRKEALRRLTIDGGYAVEGFDLAVNAKDFGVPQSRRRVLIMGSRVSDAPRLSPHNQAVVTVREALEGLPNLAQYRNLLFTDEVLLHDDDVLQLRSVRSAYARRLAGLEIESFDRSWPRIYDDAVLTNSLRTVHTPKTVQRFSRTGQGAVERVSRLFRLDPEGQARTLRAGTGTDRGSHTSPRPIHPEKNRVITVREAARLHGYPDWFRFHGTNWHGHRQVGNSVPPPLAAAAGRALVEALGMTVNRRPASRLPLGDPEWLWRGPTAALAELTAWGCPSGE